MASLAARVDCWVRHAVAAAGYALLACALTWPLPLYVNSRLLGDPTGDTGVYVWNLWVFQHELLIHRHLPVSTEHVFAYTNGADFALHNYTPLAGLVATPLVAWIGIIGAFNLMLLACLTLSGFGVYMLARRLGLGAFSSWAGGALFIASPVVTAKETAHFSLVTAAPLPIFLWALVRTLDRPTYGNAALVGVMVAIATYSDAYYGVYCLLMGLFVLGWRFIRLDVKERPAAPSRVRRWLDVSCLIIAVVVCWRILTGTTTVSVGPIRVGLATLYTPMLLLTVLAGLRALLNWRFTLGVDDPRHELRLLRTRGALAVAVTLTLLSPILVGLAFRYVQGRLPDTPTYWRSSPRGVDLLAYIVPNPNNPWFGPWTRGWFLPPAPDAFPEYVASVSLVAFIATGLMAWRGVLPRMWIAFTAAFALLSLGPFIHIGGVNTFVTGPWAVLRYVPIVGMARSPARFAIVAVLGLSILSAFALEAWLSNGPRRRTVLAGILGLLVAGEVLPIPRTLYSAETPDVYRLITANDGEQGRLLELPTGIRDGTSSVGDFNASSQFFQTRHGRPLIGGYLSRVSQWRKRENRRAPMLRALHTLSEHAGPLSGELEEAARDSRDMFLARSCIKYVIVNKRRASAELRAFAEDALDLTLIHEDPNYALLTPVRAPACEVRARRRTVPGR